LTHTVVQIRNRHTCAPTCPTCPVYSWRRSAGWPHGSCSRQRDHGRRNNGLRNLRNDELEGVGRWQVTAASIGHDMTYTVTITQCSTRHSCQW